MLLELERFITVVQEGSFTKASQKLFITQPALSQSVKRLEKEVGVILLRRVGRQIVLTEDGEVVYHTALQMIKLWGKIKDPAIRNMGKMPIYSIGMFDNAALKLSKYFQKKLSAGHFQFEITIDRSAALWQGMQNGLYDICICVIKPSTPVAKNVVLVQTFSEKLYAVSGKKWRSDLSQIPFILYNKDSETRHYIDATFLKQGIKPNIIVESTSPTFMKELAIDGGGVALLPKNFIERELQQKKLFIQKFPFNFYRQIGLFLNKESNIKTSDEVVRKIVSYLK